MVLAYSTGGAARTPTIACRCTALRNAAGGAAHHICRWASSEYALVYNFASRRILAAKMTSGPRARRPRLGRGKCPPGPTAPARAMRWPRGGGQLRHGYGPASGADFSPSDVGDAPGGGAATCAPPLRPTDSSSVLAAAPVAGPRLVRLQLFGGTLPSPSGFPPALTNSRSASGTTRICRPSLPVGKAPDLASSSARAGVIARTRATGSMSRSCSSGPMCFSSRLDVAESVSVAALLPRLGNSSSLASSHLCRVWGGIVEMRSRLLRRTYLVLEQRGEISQSNAPRPRIRSRGTAERDPAGSDPLPQRAQIGDWDPAR